jgi:hypothetical protein
MALSSVPRRVPRGWCPNNIHSVLWLVMSPSQLKEECDCSEMLSPPNRGVLARHPDGLCGTLLLGRQPLSDA